MRVKFSIKTILGLIILITLSALGVVLIIMTIYERDTTSSEIIVQTLFGLSVLIGGSIMSAEFIKEEIRKNVIIIDLEDLRKEEIRIEMKKLFDKFLEENLKKKDETIT
jgi:hypothetical protein